MPDDEAVPFGTIQINCIHAPDCGCHIGVSYDSPSGQPVDLEALYEQIMKDAAGMGWVVLPGSKPSTTEFECHCHKEGL